MVANVITPYQDLQQAVKKEMREALIDAARKLNCHPEELRIRFVRNSLTGFGGYEVERIIDGEAN